MKKIIAIFLAVVMTMSLVTVGFAGLKADAKLQFGSDGKFKMLVLADVQDNYPMKESVIQFIREALKYEAPDLVVFCGDNTTRGEEASIDQMVAPLVETNTPFTFVFGNHDDDGELSNDEQLPYYTKYPNCLAYDADPALSGCGTHNLPILSSDGTKVAYNLWMFDTGSDARDEDGNWLGYDWVRADAIEWYNKTRDELTAENGGDVVPAMAFQHIIPQEPTREIFYESPISLGELTTNFSDGTQLTVIPDITKFEGFLLEKSCPSYGNDGQWDAMVQGGDVTGLVVGHDHTNNFIVNCDGIDLIQTPGVTYASYYSNMFQGARVIEINEANPREYETYLVTSNDLAVKDGSLLPELDDRSEISYSFNLYFSKVFEFIYDFFLKFLNGTL